MPNTYWDLFTGYTVFWFVFVIFGWRLVRAQRKLAHDLSRIEEKLIAVSADMSAQSKSQCR